jgi:hypothetical protein
MKESLVLKGKEEVMRALTKKHIMGFQGPRWLCGCLTSGLK